MSSLNKKNLHLKNMISTSPLSRKKLNVPNIILVTSTNIQTNSMNISDYLNKQNKLLKNLCCSFSSNKKKLKSGNSSNKKSNSVKKQANKNLVSLGSSPLITSYTKSNSNLNSKRNSCCHDSFSKISPKETSFPNKNIIKRNLNEIINSTTFSNNLFNKKILDSYEQKNKFKSMLKKEISKNNKRRNIFSHRNNISSEDFLSSTYHTNIYYSDFFKKLKNKNNIHTSKEKKSNSVKKNNIREKSIQLQTKFSTSQSTLNKKKINNNNENDNVNINNIENPEELHFYFVYVFQNRKYIEEKFENIVDY
jgi:hypothetical protein